MLRGQNSSKAQSSDQSESTYPPLLCQPAGTSAGNVTDTEIFSLKLQDGEQKKIWDHEESTSFS